MRMKLAASHSHARRMQKTAINGEGSSVEISKMILLVRVERKGKGVERRMKEG